MLLSAHPHQWSGSEDQFPEVNGCELNRVVDLLFSQLTAHPLTKPAEFTVAATRSLPTERPGVHRAPQKGSPPDGRTTYLVLNCALLPDAGLRTAAESD